MAPAISFTPYLGWTDATDPNNIPAEIKLITAADLLRYEAFGRDAAALLNTHETKLADHESRLTDTASTATSAKSASTANANSINSLQGAVSTNTADITNLKKNRALATKTANYAIALTDSVVIGNGAAVTLTLPSPVNATAGKVFTLKNINAASLTIATAAGTIDGYSTWTLGQWDRLTVISDGANWFVI